MPDELIDLDLSKIFKSELTYVRNAVSSCNLILDPLLGKLETMDAERKRLLQALGMIMLDTGNYSLTFNLNDLDALSGYRIYYLLDIPNETIQIKVVFPEQSVGEKNG